LDGLKAVFPTIDSSTKKGRRDLVSLSVLYDTCARIQEVANLLVVDM
jgi:site-specific recombinase XerD